jgi:hypothetical protein
MSDARRAALLARSDLGLTVLASGQANFSSGAVVSSAGAANFVVSGVDPGGLARRAAERKRQLEREESPTGTALRSEPLPHVHEGTGTRRTFSRRKAELLGKSALGRACLGEEHGETPRTDRHLRRQAGLATGYPQRQL